MDSEGVGAPLAWSDANHGAYLGKQLVLTSNGGITWYHPQLNHSEDSIFNRIGPSPVTTLVYYPYPGVIIVASSNFPDHLAISRDTGKTWEIDNTLDPGHIDFVLPNRWVAPYGTNTQHPIISTDSGRTWKASVSFSLGNFISFKDSLNGLAANGYDIVASTSDGGYTWQTLDSSDYMFGRVTPALGLDSSYYAFSPFQDTLGNGAYAFFTWNRGVTWKRIMTNGSGYAFAGLDSIYWVGGTGYASIVALTGGDQTFTFSAHDSTRITPIDKNFVWVWNGNTLHAAQNIGVNVIWGENVATLIPGYDSSQSYRFVPVDREIVYVRTPDTIYITQNRGQSWSFASSMPDRVLDAMHWFIFTSDTTSLLYTSNGGLSFTTITVPNANAHTILPVDSVLWYVNGFYTTNAGKSWQRIPGWDNSLSLYVIDSTTAFGEPFADGLNSAQILWRLDLPLALPPMGIVQTASNSSGIILSATPNPVTGSEIRFSGSNGSAANLTLTVYDVLGREVGRPVSNKYHEAGEWEASYDISKLPSGTYTYRLQVGQSAISKQFVIER